MSNPKTPPPLASAAPTLSYETPLDLSMPPQRPVPLDDGPFEKFGGAFTVRKQQWVGKVLMSPKAFYLVKMNRHQATGAGVGGIAGVLIQQAIQGNDESDVRTCSVSELPAPIRSVLDPKGKLAARDVIVLPRDAVRKLTTSYWRGIVVDIGQEQFGLAPTPFRGAKRRRQLVALGWPLNTDMTPTAEPMHGRGFNRNPNAPKKRMAMWKRVVMILGAILLFGIVVLAQVLKN
ncbi:MAG TPA: hypothetical protein PK402_10140 [Tepidisphaeraceae bacterium]|nr:hypothetical protein [Tepidisphaeraceae bacterium]